MKESYEQGLASQFGLKSYAGDGNIMGVALTTRVQAGQPLSSEIILSRADLVMSWGRQHGQSPGATAGLPSSASHQHGLPSNSGIRY